MRVPGFRRLVVSLLLGRVSGSMLAVALVLFVLSRYHSPQLAGASVFLLTFPGLLVSPIAGALLDRYGRALLVTVDYLIAAGTLFLLAGLSAGHALPAPILLAICGVSSLTGPLSAAGARSLFPILVPNYLWERANALDSSTHVLASLIGAPLAGVLVAFAGGEWALAATASLFAFGAIAMFRVHDPGSRNVDGEVFADAWAGLMYVVRNRTLSGLALTLSTYSLGWGCLVIAVPVLVLGRLHEGPAAVGYLWGLMGAAGIVSALLTGRIRMMGRERQLIVASILASAAAMAVLPLAGSFVVIAAAVVAIGLANGPFDIAFFTLRQRRTDPARFGRVFAVSMSLNMIGQPIGSALAGPLIGWSLNAALWVAVLVVLLSAVFPIVAIPADAEDRQTVRAGV
jgi:MFS family permease